MTAAMLLCHETAIRDLQDAWSILYAVAAEKLTQFYGRPGAIYLRKSVKAYGYRLGELEKEHTLKSGAKLNLYQLFWNNHVQIPDPRFKIEVQFITEEAAVYNVLSCPILSKLREGRSEELLIPYCEEFSKAFNEAFCSGYGQCNLSEIMTQPNQMGCCFSEYFRKTNVPEDMHGKCFSDNPPCDPFQEGAHKVLAIPDMETSCNDAREAAARQALLFWESVYLTLLNEDIKPCYNSENVFFADTLKETCAEHLTFWGKRAANYKKPLNRKLLAEHSCINELSEMAQVCIKQPLLSGLSTERAERLYRMVELHYLKAADNRIEGKI